MKRVIGIGGIFFKAKDAPARRAWYKRHLGIDAQDWGGTTFAWADSDGNPTGGTTVWSVTSEESDQFAPSDTSFMVNYRVDDLRALVAATVCGLTMSCSSFRPSASTGPAYRRPLINCFMSLIKMRAKFLVILLCCYWGVGAAATFEDELVQAAIDRTEHTVRYDGAYYSIDYPGGDVPTNIGVCTDVLIRSYRKAGVDLQKEVHEDIVANFDSYPSRRIWGLSKPDTNIDHRRVPNLQAFFKRKGHELPITDNASDYKAGEIVSWMLPGNIPHIGIVTDRMSDGNERPLIAHNIGSGPRLEDMLFEFEITGHYRYVPEKHKQ